MDNILYKTLHHKGLLSLGMLIVSLCSCKKFIEIPPPENQIISETVFAEDNSAIATLNGLYSTMMQSSNGFSSGVITLYTGLSADELYYFSSSDKEQFAKNQIPSNSLVLDSYFWQPAYSYIYQANNCIQGATNSTGISNDTKNIILGESLFIRAYCYFNLINLFGDVPLILSTDYKTSSNQPRDSVKKIYSQIIKDLKEAETLLKDDYPSLGRVRPNRGAVRTLLARAYLYRNDWANASKYATLVIEGRKYQLEGDLNKVFLANSTEAIWQLGPVNQGYNTWEGVSILPASNSSVPTYLITPDLMNSFEIGDERKNAWIKPRVFDEDTVYYPYKYKVKQSNEITENYTILRFSELYLVRSEAEAEMGNLTEALEDLNTIRRRANIKDFEANNKEAILESIYHERRVELFCETGHRWFDLKRTGTINKVLGTLKPETWQSFDALWPIPLNQIKINPKLTQNEGYE